MERKRKPLPITMSRMEFARILQVTKQPHHKIAFLLGFESGLRISEVLNLEIEDFNFEKNEIKVREGQGGKDRIVNIPVHWHKGMNGYIPIPCGKRSLQTAFVTYAAKSGVRTKLRPVHFHTLRHGYATYLIEKDVPLPYVQQMLGHSDLATTSIYINLAPKNTIKRVLEEFGT